MPYYNDPDYQRAILKLQSLPPHIRAVIDPTDVARQFVRRDASKQLQLSRMGARSRLAREQLDLTREAYDWRRDQQKVANILAGIGIPLQAASGFVDWRQKKQIADLYRNALTRT